MRPVDRGAVPQEGAQDKVYAEYPYARADLIERLGDYCSYCERQLETHCAIEHVQPKKGSGGQPHLAVAWDNFLLACVNCNATKGHQPITLQNYFWPDADNTFRAFTYSLGGVVAINQAELSTAEIQIARDTMELTGFHRQPADDPQMKDRRWSSRRTVWDVAEESFNNLQIHDSPAMRRQIVLTALGRGYFSVWMTVFATDANMKLAFIREFPGTDPSCFDPNGNPVPRPNGQI